MEVPGMGVSRQFKAGLQALQNSASVKEIQQAYLGSEGMVTIMSGSSLRQPGSKKATIAK